MSNIRSKAVSDTGVLRLLDSDEEPMLGDDGEPQTVTLYGPGSKPYIKAQTAQNNRYVDRLKKKGKADQKPEEAQAEKVEFLAACTVEFSANVEYIPDGATESLKGDALVRAIYGDTTIGFIADQVSKYLGDWGNFTKASTPN